MSEEGDDEGASGKVIDPQSFARLNEVRKDLYKGAAVGLVGGSLLGYIGFHVSSTVPALRRLHSRNTLTASVMLSGAFGSFLFALMRGQQSVVVKGLLQEIDDSGLHGLDSQGNVAMAGDHDDRRCAALGLEGSDQFHTGDPRHPDVGDNAARNPALDRCQEAACGLIGLNLEVGGLQKEPQGVPHGLIVINDVYLGLRHGWPRPPWARRAG